MKTLIYQQHVFHFYLQVCAKSFYCQKYNEENEIYPYQYSADDKK